MANNLIQIKRTSVSGRAANTTTLPNPGELAINITDGIMYSTNGSVVFEVGANNTNSQVSGTLTVNSVSANGSLGADGQVLTSNGTTVYWSAVSGGLVGGGTVSQVNTGVGLTGGPIDTTGTISVNPNTGIVANASGLFVNSAYIETLDANNASFLNGNTAADLRSYSDTVAGTAYSNAVSTAATDATNKAANAYSNAVSYAGSIAATAYSNAVATAASDATSKAATAYSNSVSYAGTIAGTAYSNAVSTAATDATNKAANAYSNAVSTAATDATNKAANAYSNSVTYFNANVNTAIDARVTKTFVDNLNVDADTLDNINSTQFLRSDAVDYIDNPTLLRYTTNNSSLVDPRGVDAVTAAPFGALMWHDLLAFNRNYTTTYETYYTSNTTWVSASVDLDLFAQKENQSKTLVTGSDIGAVRWQWFGTAWADPEWLVIGFTYTNPAANKNVIVETSADGSSWTQLHASNNITSNARINYFHLPSYSGNQYLRLTIERNDSNNLELSFISLLTARSGDQGKGKEQSLPFLWDAYKNITLEANTSANGNITATGDVTVLGENLSVGSGVTGEALIQLDASNAGYPAIYFSDNGNDQYWTLVADDGDNNFKIQGSTTSQPSGLIANPFFEIENTTGTLRNNGNRILTEADEGSGNGLDADTVDGLDSTQFLRSDAADTATGAITFSANISVSTVLANSSPGSAGQVLTSNGTVVYWTDPAGGGGGYYFGDNGTVGDANNASNIFRVNNNTLNANVTFANGQNGSATGPLTVASGATLTIQSGARVAIV